MADDDIKIGITATDESAPVLKQATMTAAELNAELAKGTNIVANTATTFAKLTLEQYRNIAATDELTNSLGAFRSVSKDAQDYIETNPEQWARGAAALGAYETEQRLAVEGTTVLTRAQMGLAEVQHDLNEAQEGFQRPAMLTSGVIREWIVLGHEAMTGNFARMPGTLVTMADRSGGLATAAGLASAGLLVMVGVAGFIAYEMYEAAKATREMEQAFDLTGRTVQGTSGWLDQQLSFMTGFEGASKKAATALLEFEASDAQVSSTLANQVNQILPTFYDAYGEKAPAVVEKLTKQLTDLTAEGFLKLNQEMLALSPAQTNMILDLIEAGDKAQAVQTILNDIAERGTHGAIEGMGQQAADLKKQISDLAEIINSGQAGEAGFQLNMQMADLKERLKTVETQMSGANKEAADLMFRAALVGAEKVIEADDKRIKLNRELLDVQKAIVAAGQEGEDVSRLVLEQNILLRQLDEEEVQRWKRKAAEAKDFFKQEEDLVKQNGAYFIRIAAEEKAAETEKINGVRTANKELFEDDSRSKEESLRQSKSNWEALLEGTRWSAENRLLIERELASAIVALRREEEAQIHAQDVAEITDSQTSIDAIIVASSERWRVLKKQMNDADQEYRQYHREEIAERRNQLNELLGYEQQFVNNVLSGRMTMGNAVLRMSGEVIEKEIANTLRYFTARMFYTNSEVQEMYKGGLAGFMYHQFFEQAKTASTIEGVTVRTTTEAAGAAEGKAAEAAAGSASVMGDAYRAAAGAYAALAGIPYVGPFIAPVAAAAAFVAVSAFDMFSAEGGFNVPSGMNPITQLHQNEMVLPAPLADTIRGLGNGGGGGTTIVIQALDTADVHRFVRTHAGAIAKGVSEYQRFNPDSRPTY